MEKRVIDRSSSVVEPELNPGRVPISGRSLADIV
jgi:hypothetical protein